MSVTPRQLEAVSAYLATGSIKGAADMLGVSPHTLARHLSNARHRAGVDTSVQLVHVLTATGRLAWCQTATMRDAEAGARW